MWLKLTDHLLELGRQLISRVGAETIRYCNVIEKLKTDLLQHYNPMVRPVENHTNSLSIESSMRLLHFDSESPDDANTQMDLAIYSNGSSRCDLLTTSAVTETQYYPCCAEPYEN